MRKLILIMLISITFSSALCCLSDSQKTALQYVSNSTGADYNELEKIFTNLCNNDTYIYSNYASKNYTESQINTYTAIMQNLFNSTISSLKPDYTNITEFMNNFMINYTTFWENKTNIIKHLEALEQSINISYNPATVQDIILTQVDSRITNFRNEYNAKLNNIDERINNSITSSVIAPIQDEDELSNLISKYWWIGLIIAGAGFWLWTQNKDKIQINQQNQQIKTKEQLQLQEIIRKNSKLTGETLEQKQNNTNQDNRKRIHIHKSNG